jgi:hypothetical protein
LAGSGASNSPDNRSDSLLREVAVYRHRERDRVVAKVPLQVEDAAARHHEVGAVHVPQVVQADPFQTDFRQRWAQHVLELPVLRVHLAGVVGEDQLSLVRLRDFVAPRDVDRHRRDRDLARPAAPRLAVVGATDGDDPPLEVDVGPYQSADLDESNPDQLEAIKLIIATLESGD